MKLYGVWSEDESCWYYIRWKVFSTQHYAVAVAQAMVATQMPPGLKKVAWGVREMAYIEPDYDSEHSADLQQSIGEIMRRWGGQEFWTSLHVQEQRLFVRRLLECIEQYQARWKREDNQAQ